MAWAGGNHGDKDSAQTRVGHPADCPGTDGVPQVDPWDETQDLWCVCMIPVRCMNQ